MSVVDGTLLVDGWIILGVSCCMHIWFLGNIGVLSCDSCCISCCSCVSGIIPCCVSCCISCCSCVSGITSCYCVSGMIFGVSGSCSVGVTSGMSFRWSVGTGILDFCICGVAWFTGTGVWSG